MAIKPVAVSQLNEYIGRVLQTDPLLSSVLVRGEISNLKYHSSGHVFFSLKDDKSRIGCFLPSSVVPRIRYELDEGMEIIAAGHISVYVPGGYYSLNISDIEVSGRGDLDAAFRKLKDKLAGEGLFAEERKKAIPSYPGKIAVVTAETGAALQDILKIIRSVNDTTSVVVYPVLVQGPRAAGEIAAALDDLNANFPDVETVIVGRGGGSAEDLWAFNEEIVARAIFRSKIPVISAVGHETDFTIADLAADRRAETPTAAARLAVPDSRETAEELNRMREDMLAALDSIMAAKVNLLATLDMARLGRLIDAKIELYKTGISGSRELLQIKMMNTRSRKSSALDLLKTQLAGLDPRAVMRRGYAAVTRRDGTFVRNIGDLSRNEKIRITGHDGSADVLVEEVDKNDC